MRSGDPANVTCTPRRWSASATASDGATCPAVPPAAIRHRSCRPFSTAGDVKEDADGEALAERVLAAECHAQAGPREGDERGEHSRDADEAELFADDSEDHVRVRLRQVVDLGDAMAEADAEWAAGAEADQRLHGLEARALRVLPRVEEAEDARAAV